METFIKQRMLLFSKSQILTFRSFFQLVGDLSELREKDYTDLQHSPGSGRVWHDIDNVDDIDGDDDDMTMIMVIKKMS